MSSDHHDLDVLISQYWSTWFSKLTNILSYDELANQPALLKTDNTDI